MPLSDRNTAAAYRILEKRIAGYEYRPGARLSPDHLTNEICIGLTPTRTELQWLHRDGLIDHRPGQGFFVKTPSASEIVNLYRGNIIQLEGSIALTDGAAKGDDEAAAATAEPWTNLDDQGASDDLITLTENVFNSIAALSGSDVVIRAVEALNSRLYFIRLVECDVLQDVGGELYALHHQLYARDYARLRGALIAYHARRLENAMSLADAACARALRREAA